MPVELSAHELSLLTVAVPFCQELKVKEDRLPTRDELKRAIFCGSDSAQRILGYLSDNGVVKVAERLQKLPGAAEVKAVTQFSLGDTSGTLTSHVLRENARLTKKLAKKGFELASETEVRAQEIRDEIEALKALAKEELSKVRKPLAKTKGAAKMVPNGRLFEINMSDAHLGKLAWSRETGHESYDTKIADEMVRRAQNVLFDRVKGVPLEKILMIVGNDLINSDTTEGTTTKGTPVSNDGRYHKTFYRARNLVIDSIEQARKIAPVHVLIMPGNHDRLASFHLGDSVECYFHGVPDVSVDNEPTPRKYFQYGKVLLGFCHGDTGKSKDLPLLMAAERPQMWSETKWREWHQGHWHQTRVEEANGVRVRIIPSLSPPDAWHSNNNFVGQLRTAEGYIWDKEEGLVMQVFYNDAAYPEIKTKREIV